jgi:hypothetical protein
MMNTQVNPMPAAKPRATKETPGERTQSDIKIYSHSPILYWWPVWLVGFLMAFLTYLDGSRLAVMSPDGVLETTQDRVASNPYLGTWFFLTLILVFVSSNVQLRGLWEWIGILAVALGVSVVSLYGLWGHLVDWFRLLHIHINLAGYVFISVWVFAIWVVSVFIFDHRTYIIFSAGQVRVLDEIGQAEKVYDVTNLTFQVQPNVLIRHRLLGFYGAGDLVLRTGGPHPEVLEWPNVLFARSRLKQIQERLKSREVV